MREPEFDPKRVYRFDQQTETFFIDIDLDYYRELYSEWDYSPQYKRDLDNDLLEYLTDCCDEIPRHAPLEISMNLPRDVFDPTMEERATKSFNYFFTNRIRREKKRRKSYFSKIVTFLVIGTFLLVLASLLETFLSDIPHSELLVEGLIIGAWVSIWEVFSIMLFKLSTHRKKIATYRRLCDAKIGYRYRPVPSQEHPTPDQSDLQT